MGRPKEVYLGPIRPWPSQRTDSVSDTLGLFQVLGHACESKKRTKSTIMEGRGKHLVQSNLRVSAQAVCSTE